MSKLPIEKIEWHDHFGNTRSSDWKTPEDIAEVGLLDWPITTVGYLVAENEKQVVLAFEFGDGYENNGYRFWAAILKTDIVKRVRLKEAK